jgi:hypothetical protein
MEHWPADHRPVKHKQTPNRGGEAESSAKGPVLYPGNGIAAAAMPRIYRTAIEHGTTRLKWDFITYQGKRPFLDSCCILTYTRSQYSRLGQTCGSLPCEDSKEPARASHL